MKYKVVRRPHVVPRGYQRGFADGELIGMRLVGEAESRVVPVAKAGVLKDFYLRHHPEDGTPIYDIDWSLDHIDKAAPPILRGIAERWPLPLRDKIALAEFIAIQMLRGARWRSWHAAFTEEFFADVDPAEYEGKQPPGMSAEEALAEQARLLSSDTESMHKMLELSRKGSQVLGSMYWTLISFPGRWLATSDHPVVTWNVGERSRQPRKSEGFVPGGMLNTLEVRFPVSASDALLMTWLDLPDEEAPALRGTKEVASNINAFTVAEAEHQWLHFPGRPPHRASGQLLPISPRLLPGYGAAAAVSSRRRMVVAERIQRVIGKTNLRGGFEVVTVRADGSVEIVPVAPPPEEAAA